MRVRIFQAGGGWFLATETCQLTFHKTFQEVMACAYAKIGPSTDAGTAVRRGEISYHG